MARCKSFRARIYENLGESSNLGGLKSTCPAVGGDDNIAPLDYVTPKVFDNSYYNLLLKGDGLLNSDQEMYSGLLALQTKRLVRKYAEDPLAFFQQFSDSMVKMGNITNSESFVNGEVRKNCRFINT